MLESLAEKPINAEEVGDPICVQTPSRMPCETGVTERYIKIRNEVGTADSFLVLDSECTIAGGVRMYCVTVQLYDHGRRETDGLLFDINPPKQDSV